MKTLTAWVKQHVKVTVLIVLFIAGAITAAILRWKETNWGDAPTWLTFLAAAVGIPFAIYQFNMQRTQLRTQQQEIEETRKRQQDQDTFLALSVQQAEVSLAALVRQQAESVTLEIRGRSDLTDLEWPRQFPVAVVNNESLRPISNVIAYLSVDQGETWTRAVEVGPAGPRTMGFVFISSEEASEQDVIRPEEEWGFRFGVSTGEDDEVDVYVKFTDDAENTWKLDDSARLRLQPVQPEPTA
jgi:hypothetical protein